MFSLSLGVLKENNFKSLAKKFPMLLVVPVGLVDLLLSLDLSQLHIHREARRVPQSRADEG